MSKRSVRACWLVVASAVLVAACAGDPDPLASSTTDPPDTAAPVDEGTADGGTADGGTAEGDTAEGGITRDDIECDEEALGADDLTRFTIAHYVVDGGLGEACFGDASGDDAAVVADAWQLLTAMTPPGQLGDLGLFAGFRSGDGSGDGGGAEDVDEEVTLAFVNTIDDEGTQFQMSINIDTAAEDPDELLLTMAHEFSHVFAGLATQLDRSDEAFDQCDTYFNGEGCYLPDSLMFAWIGAFWDDGLIDEVDPDAEATAGEGQDRCDREPGFFGAYAASTPEEDFAEAFSAYVLRVEPMSVEQGERLDWIDAQPGLAEFRERAVAASLGPVEHRFDPCG